MSNRYLSWACNTITNYYCLLWCNTICYNNRSSSGIKVRAVFTFVNNKILCHANYIIIQTFPHFDCVKCINWIILVYIIKSCTMFIYVSSFLILYRGVHYLSCFNPPFRFILKSRYKSAYERVHYLSCFNPLID